MPPSWAKNGGTTLSQAEPSRSGSRQMLDRFQVRSCSAGPRRSSPRSRRTADAHSRCAAGPPGDAQGEPERIVHELSRPWNESFSRGLGQWFSDFGEIGDLATGIPWGFGAQEAEDGHVQTERLTRGLDDRPRLLPPGRRDIDGRQFP